MATLWHTSYPSNSQGRFLKLSLKLIEILSFALNHCKCPLWIAHVCAFWLCCLDEYQVQPVSTKAGSYQLEIMFAYYINWLPKQIHSFIHWTQQVQIYNTFRATIHLNYFHLNIKMRNDSTDIAKQAPTQIFMAPKLSSMFFIFLKYKPPSMRKPSKSKPSILILY